MIPKSVRDLLGLRGGEELEIVERDGVIELWPALSEVDFVQTDDGPIAMSKHGIPPLTAEAVPDALEQTRR